MRKHIEKESTFVEVLQRNPRETIAERDIAKQMEDGFGVAEMN